MAAPAAPPALPVPAPPAAPAASRKRPAAAAFSQVHCRKTFDQCWDAAAVRKKARLGIVHACVKDVLVQMDTKKAKRAWATIGERLATLAKSDRIPPDSYNTFAEFGKPCGGGKPGMGCTKAAMQCFFVYTGGAG